MLITKGIYPIGNDKFEREENMRNKQVFISKNIQNENIRGIIKECLDFRPDKRIGIKKILNILTTEKILYKNPKEVQNFEATNIQSINYKHKEILSQVSEFATINLIKYEEFIHHMDIKFLTKNNENNILSIEIIGPPLEIKKKECGLTLDKCILLISLLNSSFIKDANIIGIIISINPPWYPFEYDFLKKKGTLTAKILFDSVFNNKHLELFHLKLFSKYRLKDNRFAINLTNSESDDLREAMMSKESCIQTLILEFIGLEGAFGIIMEPFMNILNGLINSKIKNVILKIYGNRGNKFNNLEEINEKFEDLVKDARNIKKFNNFLIFYN